MGKTKNLVILGLAFLAAGFWCNLQALWAYMTHSSILNVLGDVLPFQWSVGDCFLLVGYGVFAVLLGKAGGNGVYWMIQKARGQRR